MDKRNWRLHTLIPQKLLNFVSSKVKLSRCPNCQSSEAVDFFNWKLAQNKTDENHAYLKSFVEVAVFKSGYIYESKCCGSRWYLYDHLFMFLITPERKKVMDQTSVRDLSVPEKFKKILKKIAPSFDTFPCEIAFNDGTKNEYCLLKLLNFPQFFPLNADSTSSSQVRYIDEVSDIKESRFALPIHIREATTNPTELRMGSYLPTAIIDAEDRAFNLYEFEYFSPFELKHPIRFMKERDFSEYTPVAIGPTPTLSVLADSFF